MITTSERLLLKVSAFVAGFSLMTIELTASRVVAPHIGSSVYTWTSVIGVVLAGLAAGYFWGGSFFDKHKSRSVLSLFYCVAALSTALIPLLVRLLPTVTSLEMPFPAATFLSALLLFFVPSFWIGALSPALLKLHADSLETLGLTAGMLSALVSVGSIVGTFATGFFFIGYFGSKATLFLVSGILFLNGLFFIGRARGRLVLYALTLAIAAASFVIVAAEKPSLLMRYENESDYFTIRVADGRSPAGPVRALFLDFDSHSIESAEGQPLYTYPELYPLFPVLKPNIKTVFSIGGGAFTFPKFAVSYYQGAEVTVAEIDPEVVGVARMFFGLSETIKTMVGDARVALRESGKTYDIIFGDAYQSMISIPPHLVTHEFNELVRRHLNKGGVYAVNIVSSLVGPSGLFLKSMVATFKKTFPNMYLVTTGETFASTPQTVVLVGVKSADHIPVSRLAELLKDTERGAWIAERVEEVSLVPSGSGAVILTDDFAPVERLLAPAMRAYFNNYIALYKSFLMER